ncbi:IS3 family transposase [Veillonella caviae]|uniref:IS3 family transposase n=1 Tax=Veillonella caviae TaxID=248316 RepID=UPI003C6ED1B5
MYGTRKIKTVLAQKGIIISRRRIGHIMRKFGLVSKYTQKHYKPYNKGQGYKSYWFNCNRSFCESQCWWQCND